jgi:hypothetical protein
MFPSGALSSVFAGELGLLEPPTERGEYWLTHPICSVYQAALGKGLERNEHAILIDDEPLPAKQYMGLPISLTAREIQKIFA